MIDTSLRAGQKIGKYRVVRRLAHGGFATVYAAQDSIEGTRVALKIPHPHLLRPKLLESFRQEVRLTARLDHSSILPLKNADYIGERFVIVFPLGEETLAHRLTRRVSTETALLYADQMVDAVAHAHRHRIMHCDIKPDNFILFSGNRLRLTDFGIARIAHRTLRGSGSGTIGFMAPEQAMGKPSLRSDVFSLGLLLYRMHSGSLPEWPFLWPPDGHERLRRRLSPDYIELLRRAMEIDPRRRYPDAVRFQAAYHRVRPHATRRGLTTRRRNGSGRHWREVRFKQFERVFGSILETRFRCDHCSGPVSESMAGCPWCGVARTVHYGGTRFPDECPRCSRGVKLDWKYCAWCYGPKFDEPSERQYSDVRYTARCSNSECARKLLMPFMRYCPWCHRKVARKWTFEGTADRCPSCRWSVVPEFWEHCPWCIRTLKTH